MYICVYIYTGLIQICTWWLRLCGPALQIFQNLRGADSWESRRNPAAAIKYKLPNRNPMANQYQVYIYILIYIYICIYLYIHMYMYVTISPSLSPFLSLYIYIERYVCVRIHIYAIWYTTEMDLVLFA